MTALKPILKANWRDKVPMMKRTSEFDQGIRQHEKMPEAASDASDQEDH
jgi:hypothetical protein